MKTKIRGLRRKCNNMVMQITEQTKVFPQPHEPSGIYSGYWHLPLPVAQDFIDSAKAPFGVRRLCVQTLVNRAYHLAAIAPVGDTSTRVVVAVSLPNLWQSQIIVFFGSDYFDKFFSRNTATQTWTRLEGHRSLVREWKIQLPDGFSERGYHEEIDEPDFHQSGEIWFVGQITAG